MASEETPPREPRVRRPVAEKCGADMHVVFWSVSEGDKTPKRARVVHNYLAMEDRTQAPLTSERAFARLAVSPLLTIRRRRCFSVVNDPAANRSVRVLREDSCDGCICPVEVEERGFFRLSGGEALAMRGPSERLSVAYLQELGDAFVLRAGQEPLEVTAVVTPDGLARFRAALVDSRAAPLATNRRSNHRRSSERRSARQRPYAGEWERLQESDYVFCCEEGAYTNGDTVNDCSLYEVVRSTHGSDEPTKLKQRAFYLYTEPCEVPRHAA